MLSPGRFDVPALSPSSQISTASAQEAVTPTAAAMAKSNFSPPRSGATKPQGFPHTRTPSHASSFKESHGFTLSPSLLIPGSEYHQQMLAHEADELPGPEDFPQYEEPTLTMDTSTLLIQPRTSASTTGSNETDNTASERHISTASASTDFTRLTMSTASLDIEDLIPKNEATAPVEVPEAGPSHTRGKSEPMAVLMEESLESRRNLGELDGSSSSGLSREAGDDSAGKVIKRKDSSLVRRQRAKTTSLSTPPQQYTLFPAVNANAQGSRI